MLLLHGMSVRSTLACSRTTGHARSALVSHIHINRLAREPGTTGLTGYMHALACSLTWL